MAGQAVVQACGEMWEVRARLARVSAHHPTRHPRQWVDAVGEVGEAQVVLPRRAAARRSIGARLLPLQLLALPERALRRLLPPQRLQGGAHPVVPLGVARLHLNRRVGLSQRLLVASELAERHRAVGVQHTLQPRDGVLAPPRLRLQVGHALAVLQHLQRQLVPV